MITKNANQEILIVGTGYVGLVTAVGLVKLGHTVSCFDINKERIADLSKGIAPFYEPEIPELLQAGIKSGRLNFHDTLSKAYSGQRYVFVGVQTPTDANGKSDLSAVYAAVTSVAEIVSNSTIVIVKSTVRIGVFDELERLPAVKKNKKLTFVSCPEFLAEGTAVRDFFHPMRTIVGSDKAIISREVAGLFYGLGGSYIITDARMAQMIKYAANTFLATRVGFINDISEICEKYGINVNDVTESLVMDPRVGGGYLSPSIGFGGPCLPKDLAALIESSEHVGAPAILLRGVQAHNENHLKHAIDTIVEHLDKGNVVAVLGLSFKPNTDDVRNSFSLKIIESLLQRGTTIRASDPHAIPAAKRDIHHPLLSFFDDPLEAAKGSDLQIFLTPWDEYKALDLKKLAQVVRRKNIYDSMHAVEESVARSLEFAYKGVGVDYGDEGSQIFEVTENPARG
jgi:UDPglucose 6-dehydrogenase